MQNNYSRSQFMKMVAGGIGALTMPSLHRCATSPNKAQPNVLVIQPDQHRGSIMHCAGDTQAITPNLDRLAAEGVRFTHCASASPVCSPFRATLQTGLYPHIHGVVRNDILLDPKFTTFAEIFAEHGYSTGFIGKWHLDGGVPEVQPGGYIEPGERRQGWQEWYGYEKSHEFFNVWQYDENRKQVPVEGYDWEPTWHTDMALDFARRNRDRNKPWLYYLAYGPPHKPEQCPQEFLDMYDPEAFELPPDVAGRFEPEVEKELRRIMQVYYAQVTAVDYEIGRLLVGLKELGIDENTIILYTSDHGDKLGSHCAPGSLRGKASPFANAFRIPLIVRWPGKIPLHQVHDCLVSSVDLTPTILELAGVPIPEVMQGDSMASWCLESKGVLNEAIYLGLGGANGRNAWRAVWDGRFVYSPYGFHVLYDHRTDPHEMNNLIDASVHVDERKRLGKLLISMAMKTNDPLLKQVKESCEL